MYRIITPAGESILTDKVNYIRVHKSGTYLLTDVNRAEGVAHHGTPYLFKDGAQVAEVDSGELTQETAGLLNAMLTGEGQDMTKVKAALELRKALQLFLSTMDADTQAEEMMSVSSVFPAYQVGNAYKAKQVFSYGTNSLGDPQLYQVLQDHTSAAEWTPDTATSLYKAIGVTSGGYPEWVQPLGASDAYNTGDIVSYNGTLYKSTIDGNVWAPDVYPAGWTEYTE